MKAGAGGLGLLVDVPPEQRPRGRGLVPASWSRRLGDVVGSPAACGVLGLPRAGVTQGRGQCLQWRLPAGLVGARRRLTAGLPGSYLSSSVAPRTLGSEPPSVSL